MLTGLDLKKFVFILGTLFVLFRPAAAYAYGDDHYDRDYDRHDGYYHYHDHPRYGMRIDVVSNTYLPVMAGGVNYYYEDGLYYAPDGRHSYVLVEPPVGAIVPAIPAEYRPVMINGITYYTDNGIYYVYTRHGYRVVNPPVVRVVPQTVIIEQPAPVVVEQTAPAVVESPNKTKVVEGAAMGGVLGALTGGIIGHQMKGNNTGRGALIGGLAGAAIGGVAGAQMPNQNAAAPAVAVQPPAVQTSVPSDQSVSVNVPNNKGGYTAVVLKKSGSGYVGPQGEYFSEFPKVSQLQVMYGN